MLSSYDPVEVFDTTWALLAEIDTDEVQAPVLSLMVFIAIAAILMMIVSAIVNVFFARSISKPTLTIVAGANSLAEGDIEISRVERGAMEQASSIEEVSASVTQVSSQSTQNAESSTKASQIAGEAARAGKYGKGLAHVQMRQRWWRRTRCSDVFRARLALSADALGAGTALFGYPPMEERPMYVSNDQAEQYPTERYSVRAPGVPAAVPAGIPIAFTSHTWQRDGRVEARDRTSQ